MKGNSVVILFQSKGSWKCLGLESATVFPEVELMGGEWYGYDEKVLQVCIFLLAVTNLSLC
jgi:hypothetical protein